VSHTVVLVQLHIFRPCPIILTGQKRYCSSTYFTSTSLSSLNLPMHTHLSGKVASNEFGRPLQSGQQKCFSILKATRLYTSQSSSPTYQLRKAVLNWVSRRPCKARQHAYALEITAVVAPLQLWQPSVTQTVRCAARLVQRATSPSALLGFRGCTLRGCDGWRR
jgi:hypothetical protein